MQTWDPQAYEKNGAFVHGLAGGVLEWLDPQPAERILDLGCGDGQLTKRRAPGLWALTHRPKWPRRRVRWGSKWMKAMPSGFRTRMVHSTLCFQTPRFTGFATRMR